MIKLLKNWKKILRFIGLYFLIVGSFQYIGMLACGIDVRNHYDGQGSYWQIFILTALGLLGTLVTIRVSINYIDKEPYLKLGFENAKIDEPLIGFLVGFLSMIIGAGLLIIFHQITIIKFQFSLSDLFLYMGTCIAISFSEEILMRGYILNKFLKHFNKWTALIFSSIIFSLLHILNPNINFLSIINLFLAGMLLGIPYVFTKNLWCSILMHFSWNFFQALLGFHVSGFNFYSILIQRRLSDSVWNGGAFGYEGSIPCIIFQIMAIFIVYQIFDNRYSVSLNNNNVAFNNL